MNREEVLDKAKYIQFPSNPYVYKNFPASIKTNKLPIGMEYMYFGWNKNENHFRTSYHKDFVLPMLNELFSFGLNMNDFYIDSRFCDTYDISMLHPKKEYKFDVYRFKDDTKEENISYDDLITSKQTGKWITDYHKLYRYPHECSIVANRTINNNRKLFIIGDSQMIPDIGPLSCYFKEIWYMDNRDRIHINDKFKDLVFDDILIELNGVNIDRLITNVFC